MTDLRTCSSQFLANRHKLMAFIVGLARDPHLAEDIFQGVWIKMAEAVERGVDIQNPFAWCCGAARNLILHHWRDQRGETVIVSSRVAELAQIAFCEDEASQEYRVAQREALVHCLETVPESTKEMLRLKYEHGFSMAEIAERVQRSGVAVRKILSRIRQALLSCMERRLQAEHRAL